VCFFFLGPVTPNDLLGIVEFFFMIFQNKIHNILINPPPQALPESGPPYTSPYSGSSRPQALSTTLGSP